MEKKEKEHIILTVLAIISLLIAITGATFAYYSAISKSKPQIITTSSLTFSLNISGSTHVTNIKPTKWSNVISENETNVDIAKIPFSVTAFAGVKSTYDITMSTKIPLNQSLAGGSESDIKYKLYKDNVKIKAGNFISDFMEKIVSDVDMEMDKTITEYYKLYVYIEENNEAQNSLQNIDFTIMLDGRANQTE